MEKINVDIKQGKGMKSAYTQAPFDKGKEALENAGYRIISLEENVRLRMQEGEDSLISNNGNWTREGVIYVPKKGIFLSKKSPIMDNTKEATDYDRNERNFYLTNSQVEKALENSVELKKEEIPTNRFKDNKITVYAFGNSAEKYGKFLRDAGIGRTVIKEMPVWLKDMKDNKPFAIQLWFGNLINKSALYGVGVDMAGDYNLVRGVRKSEESTAKK